MEPEDCVLNRRGRHSNTRVGAIAPIDCVVEESVETVVILMRNGIVFMRMALGTHHRQAEPGCGGSSDAILDRLGPIFLVITAAFVIGFRIAIEAGGNLLIRSGGGGGVTG